MAFEINLWRDSWRTSSRAYIAILALLFLLSAYLLFGPKPWISGVSSELEAGGEPRPKHFVVSGLWAAAWLNLFIAAAVGIAGPWLFRRLPGTMPSPPVTADKLRQRRQLFVWLAAASVLCGVIQAPRLSKDLWGDEEYTAKRFVAGYYRRDADGELELKKPEWLWTAWDFRRGPTNHQLFSILSRVSHSFHRPSDDPQDVYFSESLIRLPSFLASIGTVFAVGWLAALIGGVRAGAIAGFVLALHPWFIRYGPEARGYGIMMLMLTLSTVFLYKAAIGGRWRHWLLFGLVEFLCFISYLGSLHFILMLNFSGLLMVAFGQSQATARWPQFGRYVVASVLAAGLVIIMLAPAIEPIRDWHQRTSESAAFGEPPDLRWGIDVLCNLATGLPWYSWDTDNPLCLNLAAMPMALVLPLLCLAAGLVIAGSVRLCRGSRITRMVLLVMLVPAPLMYFHARLVGSFLFPWYLLVALPMVAVLIALGLDWLGRATTTAHADRGVVAGALAVFLGLLLVTTRERIHLLRNRSIEPLYESVALTREIINPANPAIDDDVVTVGFSMWSEAYDPAAIVVSTAEELQAALDDAQATDRKLFVNFGQYLLAEQKLPDIMAMIEDENLFEPVAVLYGLWQPCTRWLYRAKLGEQ